MTLWDRIPCRTCGHVRHRHAAGRGHCKEQTCNCKAFLDPDKKYRERFGRPSGLPEKPKRAKKPKKPGAA